MGEKFRKAERYEEALVQFNQVKNKFPYSQLATESKLKIADIYFEREDYPEAQAAYQSFKEMHPSHPRSEYATYQLAQSFYKQLPSTIDRDLSIASRAIVYFDEVLLSYPRGEYVAKAKEGKANTLKMLADKEYYIANYYFIRDQYESALGRFENLLRSYPNSGLEAKALYGAAYSAYKTKEYPLAKRYYSILQSRFAKSEEAQKAKGELDGKL